MDMTAQISLSGLGLSVRVGRLARHMSYTLNSLKGFIQGSM